MEAGALKRSHSSSGCGLHAIIRKGLSHQPMDPVLITAAAIRHLDLTPLDGVSQQPLAQLMARGPVVQLKFDWPREAEDPRELAECPEPRLWSLRADARFPWLPLVLERDQGSLIRHVAMVVPHSFNRGEGLRFDPQALELWITHRLMSLDDLCSAEAVPMRGNLSQMAAALGYELDMNFWSLLDSNAQRNS